MENEKNAQTGTTPVSDSKIAFNPFAVLSVEEQAALIGSFNKQWKQANAVTISLAMTEHGCSENEAILFASLRADATAILDRNAVTDAVDSITAVLRGVAFPKSADVSLGLIKGTYDELKLELRKTAGIRVRDFANKEYEQNTASAILNKVYKHLGITEKDWMR